MSNDNGKDKSIPATTIKDLSVKLGEIADDLYDQANLIQKENHNYSSQVCNWKKKCGQERQAKEELQVDYDTLKGDYVTLETERDGLQKAFDEVKGKYEGAEQYCDEVLRLFGQALATAKRDKPHASELVSASSKKGSRVSDTSGTDTSNDQSSQGSAKKSRKETLKFEPFDTIPERVTLKKTITLSEDLQRLHEQDKNHPDFLDCLNTTRGRMTKYMDDGNYGRGDINYKKVSRGLQKVVTDCWTAVFGPIIMAIVLDEHNPPHTLFRIELAFEIFLQVIYDFYHLHGGHVLAFRSGETAFFEAHDYRPPSGYEAAKAEYAKRFDEEYNLHLKNTDKERKFQYNTNYTW